MANQASICVVCAWRETCQKKFSVSGSDIRCADFTKDIKRSATGPSVSEKNPAPAKGKGK